MKKIVCISDTHTYHNYLTAPGSTNSLPDGDLLIHAGDFSNIGGRDDVKEFIEWLIWIAPRYTHGVVFIAGNHDKSFDPKYNYEGYNEGKPQWLQDILSDLELSDYGVTYLENSSVVYDGIKIWGSPITPWFYGDTWAFNKQRGDEIDEVWKTIPDDTDIIVTHGPAYQYGDFTVNDRTHVGCADLGNRIHEIKPKMHVFGHIHEGFGVIEEEGTAYINASICTERYKPINQPIVWNL